MERKKEGEPLYKAAILLLTRDSSPAVAAFLLHFGNKQSAVERPDLRSPTCSLSPPFKAIARRGASCGIIDKVPTAISLPWIIRS
jgi:hypothetical protein